MKKWVRWWGLIAFLAVTGSIIVFWLFFADGLLRRLTERTGTALAGAEVDVDRTRLSLFPLGVSLSGIRVTDPKNPSTNSIEIGRVACSLDALNLLRRKVIISEMAAEGLRFGTLRKTPGFVAAPPEEKKPQEKKPSSFTLPSFDMPDVKKILQAETFESPKIIDGAQADIKAMGDGWQKRIAGLPDKAAIDAYQARIDKLTGSSKSSVRELAGTAGEIKKLKEDITGDLDRVGKSRAALSADLSSAKNLAAKAEQAPAGDVRRIRDKYALSPSGLRNMSQALFGGKIVSWFDTGLLWYGRIAPLLSSAGKKGNIKVAKPIRGKGVDVRFPEKNPLPDFLIRTVKASMEPEAGSFSGTIRNITRDQDVLGAPLTFQFDGSALKAARAISLSGSLDHIRPTRIDDVIRIQAKDCSAADMILSGNKELPVSLREGSMDIDVQGQNGPAGLRAKLVAQFKSVRIDTGQEGGGLLLTSLRNSLSRVSAFSLTADVSGMPGDYDVKVSSDLDRVLQNAVGRTVQEQGARLEKELKAAVQAQTGDKLKELQASLGGLTAAGKNLDGVQSQLNALLQEVTQKGAGKTKLPF